MLVIVLRRANSTLAMIIFDIIVFIFFIIQQSLCNVENIVFLIVDIKDLILLDIITILATFTVIECLSLYAQ